MEEKIEETIEETTEKEETSEPKEEKKEEPKPESKEEEKTEETSEDSENSEKKQVDKLGREMYKAKCADCGKDCEVPFKPSGDRPVYCRDCYRKHAPKRRY